MQIQKSAGLHEYEAGRMKRLKECGLQTIKNDAGGDLDSEHRSAGDPSSKHLTAKLTLLMAGSLVK